MKNETVTTIKISVEEKRYALALSRRMSIPCPRPDVGSVAHALKTLLHERAKQEKIKLNGSIYFV
jgi:hypothetical protein